MSITVSNIAAEKLIDELIRRCFNIGLGYRTNSCAPESNPHTFNMMLDKERPGDEVAVSHGIRIFLNPVNNVFIKNYELDYSDELNGSFYLKKK